MCLKDMDCICQLEIAWLLGLTNHFLVASSKLELSLSLGSEEHSEVKEVEKGSSLENVVIEE